MKSISNLERFVQALEEQGWTVARSGAWGAEARTLWGHLKFEYRPQGWIELVHLYVTPSQRGNKHGTALMQAACETADQLCISLVGYAMPLFDSTGLLADRYALMAWYGAFGFSPIRDTVDSGIWMRRD